MPLDRFLAPGDRDALGGLRLHRDFAFASRNKAIKLRYLMRLYAKEMVQRNFPGLRGEELLDRLVELLLYTEEHLR